MKNLSPLFLIISVVFIQNIYCQSTVYVKTNQFGRGILKTRGSECFVITPEHVIKNYYGPITVIGNGSVSSRAQLKKAYLGDLAVLEFSGEYNQNCTKWQLDKNYSTIIDNISEGYIELREEDGSSSKFSVNIVGIDVQYLIITPKNDSRKTFSKGMSGSSLFVEYQGKKVFLGMFQSIDDNVTGNVIRADVMDNLLSDFFNPIEKKKSSKVISEQVLTKEVQDFKFDLLDINKSGHRVTFTFDVTSLKSDKVINFRNRDILLYDNMGSEYVANNIFIANKSQKYGYTEHKLIKGTSVSLKISFIKVTSSAQFATLFKVGFSDKESTSNFEFKDLYFGDESENLSEAIDEKGYWSKESLDFKFDLLDFSKTGTDVEFTFTITSIDRDKSVTLSNRNILLYDNMGSEYAVNNILLANKPQNYGYTNHQLIQGIQTPLIFSFKDVASSATGVALLKVGFRDDQNGGTIQIRNLTFPEKTAIKTETKTNANAGKPSTSCSEIYFYRKNSMLECEEAVYLYNHGELLAKLQPGVRFKSLVCDDRSFKFSVRTNPTEIALSNSKPDIELGKKYYLKINCNMGISTISLQENGKGEKDITNNKKFKRKLEVIPMTEY